MFDIAPTEMLLVAIVALVVIGPKDLPRVMRSLGYWVGRARGAARHFRSGFDAMVREAEMEELERKWKAENERIMREHPHVPDDAERLADEEVMRPLPAPDAGVGMAPSESPPAPEPRA